VMELTNFDLAPIHQIMEKYEVYRIVYSSSATVYGAPKQIPIPETSVLAPESVYGRTKHMSELILKDVCDSKPDLWRAIGLRYFNPAGSHPSGEIGEDPRGKPGNLLPLLSQMATGKFAEEGLKIFGNDYPTPDGTCVRDYLHGQSSLLAELLFGRSRIPLAHSPSLPQSWTSPRVTSTLSLPSFATRSSRTRLPELASAAREASTRLTTSARARE
jgi:hypothetical protein